MEGWCQAQFDGKQRNRHEESTRIGEALKKKILMKWVDGGKLP